MNGSAPDGSSLQGFEELCPGNGTVSGYQTYTSSGGGILQLRMLCTAEGTDTSGCSECPESYFADLHSDAVQFHMHRP